MWTLCNRKRPFTLLLHRCWPRKNVVVEHCWLPFCVQGIAAQPIDVLREVGADRDKDLIDRNDRIQTHYTHCEDCGAPAPRTNVTSVARGGDRFATQIAKLPAASRLLGRKEICELPSILWDDEDVLDIVQGLYNNGNGILVSTQLRLVFVDKGLLYGLKVEDFSYEKVSSVQYETGLFFGTITIFTSGNKAVISQVDKTMARSFAEGVRARMSRPKPVVAIPPRPALSTPAAVDIASQLERLASLKQQGFLTNEEFTHQKRKLLGLG
jgi:hypothetical protein